MATNDTKQNERLLFAALAACCVLPMVGIVVLTSAIGVAVGPAAAISIGPAAAISIGVVAAVTCVTVMAFRHRDHSHHEEAGP